MNKDLRDDYYEYNNRKYSVEYGSDYPVRFIKSNKEHLECSWQVNLSSTHNHEEVSLKWSVDEILARAMVKFISAQAA